MSTADATWTRCACTETSAGECSRCEAKQRERHTTGFVAYEAAISDTADAALRAAQDHRHIYARYNRNGRR